MDQDNIEISKEMQKENLANKIEILNDLIRLLESEASLQHVTAASFAHLGFNILPISSKSKIPKKIDGYEFGTTDLTIISRWWTRWPKANIALCLENLIVLKFEFKSGINGYQALMAHSPNEEHLPSTYMLEFPPGVHNFIYKTTNEGIHSCKNCPVRGVSVITKDKYLPIDAQIIGVADQEPNFNDVTEAPHWLVELVENHQANQGVLVMPQSISTINK